MAHDEVELAGSSELSRIPVLLHVLRVYGFSGINS
jgi:hypothetical protein